YRVLERHEHALARAILRFHREEVFAFETRLAPGDLVRHPAREDLRKRRLAALVRPHHRVDLAVVDREVDSLQDLLAGALHLQVLDFEHRRPLRCARRAHPTVPSRFRLTPISFWPSTANSIGRVTKAFLPKPF